MIKLLSVLSLLAGMCAGGAASAQQVNVINSLPDFERFWSQAQGKPFDEQERLWSGFEAKYPEIYERIVFPRSDPNWQARRNATLRTAFARLPDTAPKIIAMMRDAQAIAARGASRFRQAFPDLEPGTPVVFIPISTFNVAVRGPDIMTAYGRDTLVFGVDYVIDRNDSLEVVFAHEFFHIYQFGKLRGRSYNPTMGNPLWTEGLATYVSAAMNPGAPADAVFMDPELAAACTPANVATWSKAYLDVYQQDVESASLQSAWFRAASEATPRRRGYCVGFHVARALASTNTLAEMAGWDQTVYQPKLAAALRQLAAAGPPVVASRPAL